MQTNNETTTVGGILPTMRAMETGATVSFPLNKMHYVRSLAVQLGTITGRRYTTHIDRTTGVINVTRKM